MTRFKSFVKSIFAYTILLLSLTLFIFSLFSYSSNQASQVTLFGFKTFIVRSNSMAATDFKAGDLIVIKAVNPKDLKVGDIISFKSLSELNYNEVVSHKIRKINQDKNNLSFTTYGSSTNVDDKNPVFANNIIGRYIFKISKIGYFLAFLKNPYTLIYFLIIGLIILIIFTTVVAYRRIKGKSNVESWWKNH